MWELDTNARDLETVADLTDAFAAAAGFLGAIPGAGWGVGATAALAWTAARAMNWRARQLRQEAREARGRRPTTRKEFQNESVIHEQFIITEKLMKTTKRADPHPIIP